MLVLNIRQRMAFVIYIFFAAIVAIAIAVANFWWNEVIRIRLILNWVPSIPGFPIIGNGLEFSSSTESLKVLDKFTKKGDGIIQVRVLNRTIIVITDYNFCEFLLTNTKLLTKTPDYRFLHRWLGTGLLTAKEPKWGVRRRIITPAFHYPVLEKFVEVFDSAGKILIAKLEKEVDKDIVNIYPYITLCALDIICETAMGVSVHAQDNSDSDYVRSVRTMCRIILDRSFSPFKMFDSLYYFSKDYYKEIRSLKILHNHSLAVISSRIEGIKKSKEHKTIVDEDTGIKKKMAFLDLLLKSTVDGKPLTKDDIREEVDTFIFEGHDTTAAAMGFALYSLALNSEVQKKAVKELFEIFGDDPNRPTTFRDLHKMKYLELVLKETLRLYPSVPYYGRETDNEIEYDGNIIPKGISIIIFAYGVNRNPKYFANPDKFDPSRFEILNGKNPYAYLPFSAGSRNCIGQKFAMLEMKCTISKILRNYELLPAPPGHKAIVVAESVLNSANGINIRLKKRDWKQL